MPVTHGQIIIFFLLFTGIEWVVSNSLTTQDSAASTISTGGIFSQTSNSEETAKDTEEVEDCSQHESENESDVDIMAAQENDESFTKGWYLFSPEIDFSRYA